MRLLNTYEQIANLDRRLLQLETRSISHAHADARYLSLHGGDLRGDLNLHAGLTIGATTKFPIGHQTYLVNYNSATGQVSRESAAHYLAKPGGTMSGSITFAAAAKAIFVGGAAQLQIGARTGHANTHQIRLGGTSTAVLQFLHTADSAIFDVTKHYVKMHTRLVLNPGSATDLGLAFGSDETTGLGHHRSGELMLIASGAAHFRTYHGGVTYLPQVPAHTTSHAGNIFINTADGRLYMHSSARRYKRDIRPAGHLADLTLRPVTYTHRENDTDHIGFIAEDIEAEDRRAVTYNGEGAVQDYDPNAVVAILAAKVNRLEQRSPAA